jgi:transposase-like protein
MEEEVCWVGLQGNDEAEEIRRLKRELARVTEERDILKNAALGLWAMISHPWRLGTVFLRKAAAYFARDAK